ncbi:MAG: ATP-binding protein [Acidobacteria bacterium]|nr:MAG: ATP-binding protein [Acidobacteriota bacterium]REK01792.1 MAG: ATP-binding protein [Acidobacteriota bacterium]REK14748.1 MAG: ATP-binding protein [Acidobacteriota bacterium]REK45463.1 MAG: ATP-binding protein [Acidobacteriota bacterium]
MSSANEKVKDLLEVRSFNALKDFHSVPSATLETYRFTDITAGLMASWLDSVSRAGAGHGSKKALAGYRGVGKSHFLAAFGAILANPDLRGNLTDSHVATSASGLLRRRYPVATVLRGTRDTLFEEVRAAVALSLGLPSGQAPNDLSALLELAASEAGDMPFVILIDTAFDRKARVKRDDGVFLGELAAASSLHDIFIGVALDDDITDADGTNSVIVQQYTIDYLEQEHLYKIVDAHIFPKIRTKNQVVDQAYEYFREVLPDFRFSQERFSSLYPLHPLILEIAPVVRLYAPDFALLNFASEAGKRILGRPSRSLIGLDEVFDCVESTLRNDENLRDAFTVYDKISSEITSLVPVIQRLQAKLILKALFILSLEGDGVSSGEICAAILIYDENNPEEAISKVSELLEKLVTVFPDDFWRVGDESGDVRYSLKVSGKDNLNHALAAAIKEADTDSVPKVLKRAGKERYADWMLSPEKEAGSADWSDVQTIWRGSLRKIRLFWNWGNEEIDALRMLGDDSAVDLFVVICGPGTTPEGGVATGIPAVIWQPAELTKGEIDTILRYSVLLQNEEIRVEFQDQIGAAGHTHTVAVEKIWKRAFLHDPKITVGDLDLPIPEKIAGETSLGSLLSLLLAPVFDEAYADHPVFVEPLGMREVSTLVSDLFSGARVGHQTVQHLAETFALPLGLVSERGENLVLEKEEKLFSLHLVEKVLTLIGQSEEETVPLDTVYRKLRERPYGLAREAQHLILSALVAQGKIEFVTSKGDRINRRSLDLKIIWDDISGISKPQNVLYGSKRLTEWARLISEVEGLQSIDIADDRRRAKVAFKKWLKDWEAEKLLEKFDSIDSDDLNTKIWNIAINAEKTFGVVQKSLSAFFEEAISLEEALQRIADAFSDSEAEFEARKTDLMAVAGFIEWSDLRGRVINYLSVCEYLGDETIDGKRERIEALLIEGLSKPGLASVGELESAFEDFRRGYAEAFAAAHNRVVNAHDIEEKVDEILASDEWWEFSNLARMPIFGQDHFERACKIVRRLRGMKCVTNVQERIYERPFCDCSFRIRNADEWHLMPKELIAAMLQGSDSYKRTLSNASEVLAPLLESLSANSKDDAMRKAAESAIKKITAKGDSAMFDTLELQQLNRACEMIRKSPAVKAGFPNVPDLATSAELRDRLDSWASELPSHPIQINIR